MNIFKLISIKPFVRIFDIQCLVSFVVVLSTLSANALEKPGKKMVDLYSHEYHAQLVTEQLTDLDELVRIFQDTQRHCLVISPPDPDFVLSQSGGLQTLLDAKAFPPSFLSGLVDSVTADGPARFRSGFARM